MAGITAQNLEVGRSSPGIKINTNSIVENDSV
jgi:hypothetical protein